MDEITMAEVAELAGFAKGTVFIYFPTKEALFLEMLGREISAWVDEVNAVLTSGPGRWSTTRVARLIAESMSARVLLTRLLPLLSGVLERNLDNARLLEFKTNLLAQLESMGALLERRLDFLQPGEGIRVTLRIYAVVIGVRILCAPGAGAREVLARPEMQPLVVDFDEELMTMMLATLQGLELRTR